MSRIHTGSGGLGQQPPQLSPDFLTKGTDVKCEHCGNYTFIQVHLIKHFSKLVSPNGEEGLLPFPTFACAVCNHINPSLVPAAFRSSPAVKPTDTGTNVAGEKSNTGTPPLNIVR